MENKRTLIAVVLSMCFFLGWNFLAENMGWVVPKDQRVSDGLQTNNNMQSIEIDSKNPIPKNVPKFVPSPGKDVVIETPLYKATLYTGGGIVRSFVLKKYRATLDKDAPLVNLVSQESAEVAPFGLTVNGQPSWSTGEWSFIGGDVSLIEGEEASLTFVGIVDGIKVIRTLNFNADTYLITENILLTAENAKNQTVKLGFLVAAESFGKGQYDPTRMAWSLSGSFKEETSIDTLKDSGVQEKGLFTWGGVMSNYFMNVVAPEFSEELILKGRISNDIWRVALERSCIEVFATGSKPVTVNWWFGPKDRDLLALAPNNLEDAVDFGMFSLIARPLLSMLAFFHEYIGNWGVAIILLTVSIKLAFWPLTQKSYKSMEQMKKLQPLMKEIREKYAGDREALNREMMQLYRTYKVNPAGGCLPLVLQIPVFIGLYQALLNSIELRHAEFIRYVPFTKITWLVDLSAADPFYITPILMGISMFVQQKLTPAAGDPTQQKIMMFMPIIFTVMFINFPAGLVIYWLFNNILSIGQQWWMLHKS